MNVFFQLQFLFVLAPYAACQLQKVPASNPEISAKIDHKDEQAVIMTIYCVSPEGTLPIIYTLYRNKTLMETYQAESRRKAEFLVQLTYRELLETLKCKAENGFDSKYSRGLVIDLSVKLTSNPDPPVPGQQLTLNCTVTYETKQNYTWYFMYPKKNMTKVTKQNQLIIESASSGIYYCSMLHQMSNRIEVSMQDSSFQPVVVGVSVAAVLLLILIVGLICYCNATKAHRFNAA
ncbi:uncharacterized protein pecam1b [Pristis pectinata]|uniref:uncharacterized protein pecam1b n=1 Tax=Pristis pectinata TaxID=685728 RepID=UPI00223D4086|nr:uncharacterized protein pecam1b [Pristis pectinata]